MNYFKDKENKLHVIEAGFEYLLPNGLTQISQNEYQELSRPLPETPEQLKEKRIKFLKQSLNETDYVALADYDKVKPELIAERALWRAEIRELENNV